MTSEIRKEENTVKFEIQVDSKTIEEAMDKVYKEERHNFQIPGFRKGRVPRRILEVNFGEDLFFEDGINELLPGLIQDFVEENELKLAGQPSVDLKEYYQKGEDLTVLVEVDVMPEFEVEGYKGLEVEKITYEVTDDLLDDRLDHERKQNARTTIIEDRPVEIDDVAVIDFTGFVDGEEFEGGQGEDFELTIGSDQFIKGFEDQLIGKNLGEDVEVNVVFPEDYHQEDLQGQEAVFDVTINEIRQIQYPDIDDDFIQDISEFDTVEEYKENAKKELEEQFENRSDAELRQRVLEMLPSLVEFDLPEAIVDQQIDNEMNSFIQQLSSQGIDVSQFLDGDMDSMRESFRPQAEINLRTQLVLEQIASQEDIQATDEDIDEELDKMAKMYMPNDDQEEERQDFIKSMKDSSVDFLKNSIVENKTIDMLVESANVTEKTEDQYQEELAQRQKEEEENQEETQEENQD